MYFTIIKTNDSTKSKFGFYLQYKLVYFIFNFF